MSNMEDVHGPNACSRADVENSLRVLQRCDVEFIVEGKIEHMVANHVLVTLAASTDRKALSQAVAHT